MGDACFFIGHRPEKLPWGRDTASPDFRRYYERLTIRSQVPKRMVVAKKDDSKRV